MDEKDKIVSLLNKTNSPIWRIDSKDGRKRGEYKGDNMNESLMHLDEVFSVLPNASYTISYRPTTSNEKGQYYHDFSTKSMFPTSNHQPQVQQPTAYQNQDFMYQLIQKLTKMEVDFEYVKRDIEDIRKELKNVVSDLTDDDPKNDKSAIERLTEIASAVPNIANGIKSFRNL